MRCKRINGRKKSALILIFISVLLSFFPQISSSPLPAGYHTYDEVASELKEMSYEYDTLTHLVMIGESVEGRAIYAMKISDNPTLEEDDEPDVLFVAEHHSREVITTEIAMGWIRHLLVNYDKDFYVKTLVDSREIWVVPALNPDGYVRVGNGSFDARKNAHEVDLNRNYGYMWGFDNMGSSDNPDDETYRGPSPFSEPETRAMKGLVESHSFTASISWHSGMEAILYPWVYAKKDTPDNDIFRAMGSYMSDASGYPHGNPRDGTVYVANGELDDWLYGMHDVLSFTVEVYGGTSDDMWRFFNPPATQIVPLIEKNIKLAAFIAEVADDPHRAYLTLDFPKMVYIEEGKQVVIKGTVTNRFSEVQTFSLNANSSLKTDISTAAVKLSPSQSAVISIMTQLSGRGEEPLEVAFQSLTNPSIHNEVTLILKYPDKNPPTILNMNIEEVGNTTATIMWETNEESQDSLIYGYDGLKETIDLPPTTFHIVFLQNLESNTTYSLKIISKDALDNVSESEEYKFTTTDNTPPKILDVKVESKSTGSRVEWKTDEPSSTQVKYGIDENVAQTESVGGMTESHSILLNGLSSHATYYYKIVSQDSHGNVSETQISQFETPTNPLYALGIVVALALFVCMILGVMKLTLNH